MAIQLLSTIATLIFLAAVSIASLMIYDYYERAEEKFLAYWGAELAAVGITIPGAVTEEPLKVLPPSEDVPGRMPASVIDLRKARDFWGLQSVPEVALSGVKTIDKIVRPGGELVVSMTRSVHTPAVPLMSAHLRIPPSIAWYRSQ